MADEKKRPIIFTDENAPPTLVAVVLDASSSMFETLSQTISGLNEYLDDLRRQPGQIRVGITEFSQNAPEANVRTLVAVKPVKDVPVISTDLYKPRGGTPLYDAVGSVITLLEPTPDEKVILVIVTDGEENASKEYERKQVHSMIEVKQAAGWMVVFLGVDIDAWSGARSIGVQQSTVAAVARRDTRKSYQVMASATRSYRENVSVRGMSAPAARASFFAGTEYDPDERAKNVEIKRILDQGYADIQKKKEADKKGP